MAPPPSVWFTVEAKRRSVLRDVQLDKLGVTGSSPVPPTRQTPANAGLSYSERQTPCRACPQNVRSGARLASELAATTRSPKLAAGGFGGSTPTASELPRGRQLASDLPATRPCAPPSAS